MVRKALFLSGSIIGIWVIVTQSRLCLYGFLWSRIWPNNGKKYGAFYIQTLPV